MGVRTTGRKEEEERDSGFTQSETKTKERGKDIFEHEGRKNVPPSREAI